MKREECSVSLALTETHLLWGWGYSFHRTSSEIDEKHPSAEGVAIPTCRATLQMCLSPKHSPTDFGSNEAEYGSTIFAVPYAQAVPKETALTAPLYSGEQSGHEPECLLQVELQLQKCLSRD